jgi:hypothetical protein
MPVGPNTVAAMARSKGWALTASTTACSTMYPSPEYCQRAPGTKSGAIGFADQFGSPEVWFSSVPSGIRESVPGSIRSSCLDSTRRSTALATTGLVSDVAWKIASVGGGGNGALRTETAGRGAPESTVRPASLARETPPGHGRRGQAHDA